MMAFSYLTFLYKDKWIHLVLVTNYGADKIGVVPMYTLLFEWFMVCSESNAILLFKMGKKQ